MPEPEFWAVIGPDSVIVNVAGAPVTDLEPGQTCRQMTNPPTKWLGDTWEDFKPLSPVQFRLAMLQAGLPGAAVDSAIEAIPDPVQKEAARITWEYAVSFHRDHQLVAQLSSIVGLTGEQVDAMWRQAATL